MALKRDLAGWLDAKLTEIERRHRLDEKNSALLHLAIVIVVDIDLIDTVSEAEAVFRDEPVRRGGR